MKDKQKYYQVLSKEFDAIFQENLDQSPQKVTKRIIAESLLG